MSKELVVSCSRHETRVALLEEDQVVELYIQRENEYTLAGSIHKGRVTRVLPGMQSAFVDIGLERDAFLYVSDFFEDNDEYDQVVTGVEDTVMKMERGAASAPRPATEEVPAEAAVEADAPPVPAASAPAEERAGNEGVQAAEAQLPAGERPREGSDSGDRRGRRGRRRRGRSRGFPDSKYAAASGPGEREPQAGGEAEPREAPRDIPREVPHEAPREMPREVHREVHRDAPREVMVLPGESLAKYRHPAEDENGAAEEAAQGAVEVVAAIPVDAEPAGPQASFEGPAPARAQPVDEAVPEPEAVAAGAAEVDCAIAEGQALEQEPPAPDIAIPETALAEAAPSEAGPIEGETESGGDGGEAIPAAEGVEPARIPTSLTATLREQGLRYPHRASRRMRRKGRPGGPGGAERQPAGDGQQAVTKEPESDRERNRDRDREKPPQPSISDLLKEGQEIIVQIAKEPLGQKGARITSYVALPGRYVVYMPTVDHVGVSRKIGSDEERLRLKRILQRNREGMPGGFILRTAGEGRTEEELRADMHFLYNSWMGIRQKAEKKKAPVLVHHDLGVVERILRDQLTADFKTIWVDHEEVYERVVEFVERFQPQLIARVKLYTRSTPLFDAFNVTQELEKALRPRVWLKSGGYIVINQTEALVAIDINTGKYVGKSNRLEDTIVKTNTEAVKEIVRQIRLRDLGGIIVVDFIDMDERRNRQKVMQALEEAMRADKAPNKILQFNDFGLVAITRKRVKQSLERALCAPCPYCDGAGSVKSPATVVSEILQEARKIASAVEGTNVVLRVNPEVAKVLKSHRNDYLQEIEEALGRSVLVKSDPLLHQEKFDLA